MVKVVVINGSPRMQRGNTGLILAPFVESLEEEGADVQLLYATKIDARPCNCGIMHCWRDATAGRCIHHDEMELVLQVVREAQYLVLASPVYIPLPSDMQNVINRLCPLIDPELEFIEGRTRARFRDDVLVENISLVSTTGWWETANADTLCRVVEELAADAGVQYGGAIVRPHADLMCNKTGVSGKGQEVLQQVRKAAKELMELGAFQPETLEAISRPLILHNNFMRV